MINLLNEKGRLLGRRYDYEYRGRKREAGRAGRIGRSKVICWLMALVFFGLGLWMGIGLLDGGEDHWQALLACMLVLWLIAVGIVYIWHRSNRKYRDLRAALEPGLSGQSGR